jgi:Alginate lyase
VVERSRLVERLYAQRGFLAGVAVGLAATLTVVGLVMSGSFGGSKRAATGAGSSSGQPAGAVSPTEVSSSGSTGDDETEPSSSAGPLTSVAPSAPVMSGPIALDGWKLTLPVDSAGSLSGTAKQLSTAAITDPWLTRDADGGLTFWAPASGATTANSEHARTELVSTNDWMFGSGVHTLSATLSVSQVPLSNPDICVGQVHGGGSIKSIPFVMLHYRDGNIVVVVKQVLHGSASQSITLLTGVPLNGTFSYTITDNGDGTLGLSATYNGQTQKSTVQVVPEFMGTDQRFQAGDYQQATSGTSASDGGRVTFYALSVS